MLHIILLILKIIGIVLLCVLGVLVLLALAALFVPVRYRVTFVREEGEGAPPFTATVKVTWFLHLVNILVRYPSDVILRARLMVFTLFQFPEKEKKAKKRKKKRGGRSEEQGENRAADKDDQKKKDNMGNQSARRIEDQVGSQSDKKTEDNKESTLDQKAEHKTEIQTNTDAGGQKKDTRKPSLTAKIRDIIDKIKKTIEKIKSLFENIQYTIRKFCDKIKSTLDNIQYYREVLESEPFGRSLSLCEGELISILKSIMPRQFEADLTVGLDDPAVTGEILAVYGMLYPFVGAHVRVVGDFERTHIEGNIYLCGRIRAFTFVKAAVKIYFNRNVKTLIKLLKKEAV